MKLGAAYRRLVCFLARLSGDLFNLIKLARVGEREGREWMEVVDNIFVIGGRWRGKRRRDVRKGKVLQ